MAEFRDEVVALRGMLAEAGYEITLPRLLDILENALKEEEDSDCEDYRLTDIGLCWKCLIRLVRK